MPRLNKPRPPRRSTRPSPAPRDATAAQLAPAIGRRLDARLKLALGNAQPPASLQSAGALLQALRQTYPDELGRWFPLVPELAPTRARDASRELGLDLSDLRVLYRALRVTWLAELVFGGRDQARQWLCSPKRRLLGRVPLSLCQHGRHAVMIEQWLVNIDEGNGP
nr:MbcA/ParS/Xre antitoxin family protein [uncultured Achromobacter sp.]